MITSEIIIKEPASKIWEALTDKNKMKEWYFDIPDFELKVGSTFNFYEPGDARQFHHQCVIKEIETNKKLSHTWTHPGLSKGESTVTWSLNETEGATEVTLQHEGTESFADGGAAFAPENYQMGWDALLSVLKNYVYGIRKHKFEIEINASAEKVWNVLLNDATYRQWTAVFSEGSYYKGEMKQGSPIQFLTPEGSGMYGKVIFYSPHSNVVFQHIGEVKNFEPQPVDDATEKWSGAYENYTLTESGNTTTLIAEIDINPEHVSYFNDTFPKGLEKIKELSEQN